jgi:hypothetical protein
LYGFETLILTRGGGEIRLRVLENGGGRGIHELKREGARFYRKLRKEELKKTFLGKRRTQRWAEQV